MAGQIVPQFSKSRQGRKKAAKVRHFLSSLTGLVRFPNRETSHEWLGYFQSIFSITYEAEAGEKTSETVIQKIFDELPVPGGEGRIKNKE